MIKNLGKFLNNLKPKYDDDVIDRCNYLVTNAILFICALTVAAKQYVGEPLQCWVPAEFKAGWEKYIEDYCFVENTYFVKMDDSIPTEDHLRSQKEIHYYQWVPFILMLQAFFFMIPRTVWKTFNWETGMNIFALSQLAYGTKRDGAKRILNKDANTKPIINRLNFVRKSNKLNRNHADDSSQSFWRVYVTMVYIGCKMLNLLNICIQFALLNTLLGPEYKLWGFGILNDLIHGRQWNESGHFPRVTYCDVNVREIGSVNRKTVQCVLMINMFNEKIFLGIWFWLFILGILTSVNLLYWILTTTMPQFGRTFIRDSLALKSISYTEEQFEGFLYTAICKDSVTVLRLLSDNAGELIAAEVVAGLWDSYNNDPELRRNDENPSTLCTKPRPTTIPTIY